mmetsp:Transcript_29581/g.45101  ORF Transcript_29581/g.45101 Transcript_29581/m.45101 type:complete len:98 (+) Transcript_29581:1-294(+)
MQLAPPPSIPPPTVELQQRDYLDTHCEVDPELQKEFDQIEARVTEEHLKQAFEHKRKKFKRLPIVEGHKNPVKIEMPCPNCNYDGMMTVTSKEPSSN